MESDLVLDNLDLSATSSAAIAHAIRSAIRNGRLQPGDQLPSQVSLAERYGVARETVRTALRLLDQEGLVERRQGARMRVREENDQLRTFAELRSNLAELQQSLARSRTELVAAEGNVATALDQLSRYDADDS